MIIYNILVQILITNWDIKDKLQQYYHTWPSHKIISFEYFTISFSDRIISAYLDPWRKF